MSTVVARFELSKSKPDFGTVYYRIYKGHNRRLEFSSYIRIPLSLWDRTEKNVIGDSDDMRRMRAQINADLALMNSIIKADIEGTQSMSDLAAAFKRRRKLL